MSNKRISNLAGILCFLLASALGNSAKAQIDAHSLYSYSSNNEVTFNSTYTGKTIKVKGMVTSSVFQNTEQWASGYSVWLGNCVRLFFPESNARQFANIRQGDEITIQGRCIGRGGSLIFTYKFGRPTEVFIDNCTLLQVNMSNAERQRRTKLREEAEWNERAAKKAQEQEQQRLQKLAEEKRADEWLKQNHQESASQRARWENEQERQSRLEWTVASRDLNFWSNKPMPAYTPEEEDVRIAVMVTIESDGTPIEAEIDTRHTTTSDSQALDAALDAALATAFKTNEHEPTKYRGAFSSAFKATKKKGIVLYRYGPKNNTE
jgi:flagellar biosynthesis GTPase FlhF